MTMQFKQLGLFLLVVLGTADSFAGAGVQGRDDLRGALFRTQSASLDRDDRSAAQQVDTQREYRQPQEVGLPQTSGYGGPMETGANSSDYPRRQGRMTVEERRALRRQIDEVGHDLYTPRR
jgi:hypothetical protein